MSVNDTWKEVAAQKSELKDLLTSASTPGDIATLLLAGSLGLVADVAFLHIGVMPPGTVGITSASSALGAKKVYEAHRATENAHKRAKDTVGRAWKAHKYMLDNGFSDLADRLQRELDLHEDGVTDDVSFEKAVDEVLEALRGRG